MRLNESMPWVKEFCATRSYSVAVMGLDRDLSMTPTVEVVGSFLVVPQFESPPVQLGENTIRVIGRPDLLHPLHILFGETHVRILEIPSVSGINELRGQTLGRVICMPEFDEIASPVGHPGVICSIRPAGGKLPHCDKSVSCIKYRGATRTDIVLVIVQAPGVANTIVLGDG